jgi:4-amino-4-deoxy-L-arabinose transferase-like glycosyltransferase
MCGFKSRLAHTHTHRLAHTRHGPTDPPLARRLAAVVADKDPATRRPRPETFGRESTPIVREVPNRHSGLQTTIESERTMTTLTQQRDAMSAAPFQAPSEKTWKERLRSRWPELAILTGTLVILVWGLSKNGYGNQYYAAAVRSMTYSWRNFVFGAADPGGWITTDKPPLALWFGALSARVFGFSSWSLLLPSAVCGVASVALLMAAVRRAWGRWAGRAAGIALALTPTFVAVGRVNNPDIVLVLFIVSAAYATQRAISDRRLGWMIVAGLCCGLGFLAKMLVVGFVMPGIFAAYLVAGPGGWWRRVRDALLAGGVFLLIVGAWIALIDLTPASSRPYVALSTNNTAQSLVLGARGFGDLTGGNAGIGTGFANFDISAITARLPGLGGAPGIGRLFNVSIGDQVMWLVVPALLALVAGVFLAVRVRLARPEVGSVVLWGGYGFVSYLVLAYTHGIFHDYYVSALAPALAALVGIGVALSLRSGRWGAVFTVGALTGTAFVEVVFLNRVNVYPGLRIAIPAALAAIGVALLIATFLRRGSARPALSIALTMGLAVALIAPGLWVLWAVRHTENAPYAAAGPPLKNAQRGGSLTSFGLGGFGTSTSGLPSAELKWLVHQNQHERWLVAVRSDLTAETPIVDGYSVMPWGGFYGTDSAMTRGRLATLTGDDELRFVDTGGFTLGDPNQIGQLVSQACVHVDPAVWGGSGTSTLYDCAGRGSAIRTIKLSVPGSLGASAAPPGGFKLGPASAVQRLVTCLHEHHWYPTAKSTNISSPAAMQALRSCAALIPAAVPGVPDL